MDQELTQYFDSTESPIGPAQKGQVRAAVLHDLNEALAGLEKLTAQGRNYIADTVKSPPGGIARAASGRYCSARMGVSLTAPHRFLGMAVLDTLEHDDDAIFFGEPTLLLKRENTSSKRKRAFGQRPSVIVVRSKEVVLIDIVPRASLEKQEGAGIYERSGCKWTCPSAESSASQLGMRHEVWTEDSIFTTRLANNSILADYYAHPAATEAQLDRCAAISSLVIERGAISIPGLLQELRLAITIDDIFHAIANGIAYVDLGRCDLQLQHTVRLFTNKSIGDAFYASQRAIAAASTWRPSTIELPRVNELVVWDSVQYSVKNVGQDRIVLLCGQDYVELELPKFKKLLDDGVISIFRTPDALAAARMDDASEHLLRASPKHLDLALKSLNAISPYLTGVKRSPGRTHRRYLQLYRDAETAFGNGFVGLIPGYGKSGNRQRRLAQDVVDISIRVREAELAKATNSKLCHIHKLIVLECEAQGLPPPCYSWFADFSKKMRQKNLYHETLISKGRKAAYQVARRSFDPAHPEPIRIFERVHIDHTQIDLECIFSAGTENLGRPWLTLAICHFSRRCVGMALSYEPPSARSVLLVLRDCVRRHGRLPSTIVVDGGKEFRSRWFQVVCAFYRVCIVYRPAGHPRWGAQMERMFGTVNTAFFYNLVGNTQLTKDVRGMSSEVDPSRLAIWTLPALHPVLQRFLFEDYDCLINTGIAMAPRDAFLRNERVMGKRDCRHIAYDDRFLIMTCPLVDKGTARVTLDGVKVNYFYFNAEALYTIVGQDIPVRYEPFDLSVVWGFVDGCWIPLKSRFEPLLKGYTESELQLVCEDLRKRRSNAEKDRLADTRIARALVDIHNHEAMLLARKRAIELQLTLQSEFGPSKPAGTVQGPGSRGGLDLSGLDQPSDERHADEQRDDGGSSSGSFVSPRRGDDGSMGVEISELETY